MNNEQIADSILLFSKLLEIHGENSFKIKSYASAAFNIEKLTVPLSAIPSEKIASMNGIGSSSSQKIIELLQTGKMEALENIISSTPPGIIEMLQIKGIGPKKINTIWKEMEIETVGELLYACKENRLKLFKGFGDKTQQNVMQSIEFYFKNKGVFLYAQVIEFANHLQAILQTKLFQHKVEITGEVLRQLETINTIEFITDAEEVLINDIIDGIDFLSLVSKTDDFYLLSTNAGISVKIYFCLPANFIQKSVQLGSSELFWQHLTTSIKPTLQFNDVEAFFHHINLPDIPPFLRENPKSIERILQTNLSSIITTNDIKGIIHCHSDWSDGSNTIKEMAMAAIEKGMEYLVISDHSKSAFYAQGLSIEKVKAQHQYIDELNQSLFPFKIFKSIESDILNDGSLDYPDEILAQFDVVIASIHSNLKMNEEKAMARLIKAIENPYTTILGHLTGRLLLSRPGYPVNFKTIIDACAQHHVAIELNAHPSRLDIDWRNIDYALEKNVLISIDPDSHHVDGLSDIEYGVLVAQKAMVTKKENLSSFTLQEFEEYIATTKQKKIQS